MRFYLLVPAIAAILISIQPVAFAQSLTIFDSNLIDSTDVTEIYRGEGQGKIQNLQIATSALSQQAVPVNSANPFKSNFQAKLPGLTVSVDLPELQEWTQTQVSNIDTQIATIQAWSTNLVIDTQDKIGEVQAWSTNLVADTQGTLGNIQEWSTNIVSNLSTNLQSLQEWGTGLVSNFKTNLFTLSKELNRIQQEIEATGTPEEIAEIQKAEAITTSLSEELDEIQKVAETTNILSKEVSEIEKTVEATENVVSAVATSETVAETEKEVAVSQEIENPELKQF